MDLDSGDFGRRVQDVHMPKPLALQIPHRPMQLTALLRDDMRPERAIGSRAVPLVAHPCRHVEYDRDRQDVVPLRELDERFPGLRLHVGRVDDNQFPGRQPFGGDKVKNLKCIVCRYLAVFVVGHKATAKV